ncbi:hypothetical protein K432DRAFT_103486 [Lepidopterella palustris CBS 459.81]|uniref:Uncharacterized protein n=1 Tax=Lepidopterella palustris CBS 459.81 TaxID=1314670 RepID=A0A8E2JCX5_9PEZI|nr:hypothetical protein K432DRAFT_103486 [Lepidopterella palustris CBS 459.81]
MWPRSFTFLATAFVLRLATAHADVSLNCAFALNESCQKPLEDITAVTPGEFVVAKLQCYGCPTITWVGDFPSREHIITHEENALFFNITLSPSRKELFLNDVSVFPSLPFQPPKIYATQVALDFSFSDLARTIKCTQRPCRNFDGRCACVMNALGSMSLSYDYTALPVEEIEGLWEVTFDAIGGHDGFEVDPYVVFNDSQQQRLVVRIQQDVQEKTLEIVGAELVERKRQPYPMPGESGGLSWWEKILYYFRPESDKGKEPGHVVYLWYEWDGYGRKGTLRHTLSEIWDWDWSLIGIIVGGTLAGLAVLYALYRLAVFLYRLKLEQLEHDRRGGAYEEDRRNEMEGLLDGEEEVYEAEGVRSEIVEVQTGKPLPSKPLPEKPLPPLPLVRDL